MENIAGLRHAEEAVSQQDKIPKQLRIFNLIFAGTVWTDDMGMETIAYLKWDKENNKWKLYTTWLIGMCFDSNDCLVIICDN